RRDDARDRRDLGVARSVGQRSCVRVRARFCGRVGSQPRRARRRHSRVPGHLGWRPRRALAVARRAARPSAAPGAERRARAVRVLHDLGSEDDAGLAAGTPALCGAGRAQCLRRAVLALSDKCPAVVTRRVLARRPDHRPVAAGLALPMEDLAMKHISALVVALLVITLAAPTVLAFCGFYVAKADTKLFNQASQVVLVRHDDKTVITMANDFKGDPKEFAIVVPVPTV